MSGATSGRLRALVMTFAVSGAIPVLVAPRTAHAQQGEDLREDAKRLFAQGSSAFLAKRYGEALESLRVSYKLVASPNSGLLIARCLRELNRPVEAVEMYDSVAADARRRAADGDTKYAQTADVAATEGSAVRATLGTVRVRVAHPPPGSRIEIDGAGVPATDAELTVLHPPGEVMVKFKQRVGPDQSQRATLAAGVEVRMEFTPADVVVPPPHAEPPPGVGPKEGPPPSWTVPAALAAGTVAVAGTGFFIGFGLKSRSIYDELQQSCGAAGCGSAERVRGDEGKRDQTIANVGLVVGITGAAATIAFLLVHAYAPRTVSAAPIPLPLRAAAGLATGALRVDF